MVSEGLKYQYHPAWPVVLGVLSVLAEVSNHHTVFHKENALEIYMCSHHHIIHINILVTLVLLNF